MSCQWLSWLLAPFSGHMQKDCALLKWHSQIFSYHSALYEYPSLKVKISGQGLQLKFTESDQNSTLAYCTEGLHFSAFITLVIISWWCVTWYSKFLWQLIYHYMLVVFQYNYNLFWVIICVSYTCTLHVGSFSITTICFGSSPVCPTHVHYTSNVCMLELVLP